MLSFQPGGKYHRADIKELAGLRRDAKGGPWDTGIVEHDGEFLIFGNVGIAGRTGDDYDNRWEDGLLHWYHKRRSRVAWASVKRLLEPMKVIHVFWRTSGRDPFEYAGQAIPVKVFEETSPVEVLWSFAYPVLEAEMFVGPDEAGIPQIKPTFLEIAPSGIPSNIIPHSKGIKCGLIRSNSPFSYSNHRPAKPKIPKPLVYAQVSPLGTSFATP